MKQGKKNEKGERRDAEAPHDSESTMRKGMATEGVEVDDAETMASTGNAAASFQEVASGTATGRGLDREETGGTGGLAAGEDSDEVAAGDWWRAELRSPASYPEPGREVPEPDRELTARDFLPEDDED